MYVPVNPVGLATKTTAESSLQRPSSSEVYILPENILDDEPEDSSQLNESFIPKKRTYGCQRLFKETRSFYARSKMVLCAFGICVFYLLYGIVQEEM